MTLHLVGLPYSQTTAAWQQCAFTSKLVKFAGMMKARGWPVIVYSGEQNDAVCDEHVAIVTDDEQQAWYGTPDAKGLIRADRFNGTDKPWVLMNAAAIQEIGRRAQPGDIVCLSAGDCQKLIRDGLPNLRVVEYAVGYQGYFADHACFETYAWMHHLYGRSGFSGGRWGDAVIPTMFEVDEFPQSTPDDYLLFLGRLVHNGGLNKGLGLASEIARLSGRKLVVAGAGADSWKPGRKKRSVWHPATLVADGETFAGDHLEYIGVLGADRGEVMSKAYGFLAPTTYIEPFGGAAVEAQLCGVPVVATDFGAFTETVEDGVGGFRFRSLTEAAVAVTLLGGLDRDAIRERARARYSLDAVAPQYERWFNRIAQ